MNDGMLAAKLALMVIWYLRSQVGPVEEGRFIVWPSSEILSADEAILALSQLPKPVFCDSRTQSIGELVIECSLVNLNSTDSKDWKSEAASRSFVVYQKLMLEVGQNSTLVVRGAAEPFAIGGHTLAAFLERYHFVYLPIEIIKTGPSQYDLTVLSSDNDANAVNRE